jgi:hypothetical protein
MSMKIQPLMRQCEDGGHNVAGRQYATYLDPWEKIGGGEKRF